MLYDYIISYSNTYYIHICKIIKLINIEMHIVFFFVIWVFLSFNQQTIEYLPLVILISLPTK
jgi:hypothetical protein